jgi:hypothetical protein
MFCSMARARLVGRSIYQKSNESHCAALAFHSRLAYRQFAGARRAATVLMKRDDDEGGSGKQKTQQKSFCSASGSVHGPFNHMKGGEEREPSAEHKNRKYLSPFELPPRGDKEWDPIRWENSSKHLLGHVWRCWPEPEG